MISATESQGKKIGTIQIDVDGLWVIYQHFHVEHNNGNDSVYFSALPRFLDLFEKYGIRVTFFIVGRDLLCPKKVALLKKAVAGGHEIANHTMNHSEGFSLLSPSQKIQEIAAAEELIQEKLGTTPLGFRTPSNDIDSTTLTLLEERGYVYDSSLLPTYFAPFLRIAKFGFRQTQQQRRYLGRAIFGSAPLTPYHPDKRAVWKKGSMKIMEIPISTMPLLRLPFHASFALAASQIGFGDCLFRFGYQLFSLTSQPIHFVFHTNELSDPIDKKEINRQFGLRLPLQKKEAFCHNILNAIIRHFEILPTLEYYRRITTTAF